MSKRTHPSDTSSGTHERAVSPPPSKRMKGKITSTSTKQAVASFFTPVSQKEPEKLAWRTVNQSLLVARYNAVPDAPSAPKRRRIAAFDFDSTLISTSSGNAFGRTADDWRWWHPGVPAKLRELHADGYQLAILSNQGGLNLNTKSAKDKPIDPKRLTAFKTKVGYVLDQLGLPLSLYAATSQDLYRKPRVGMWGALAEDYDLITGDGDGEGGDGRGGVDLAGSLFVGDAAGRLARAGGKIKADHSASDRGFAENVGIKFYTPEEYFLGEESVEWRWAFDPLAYLDQSVDVAAGTDTDANGKGGQAATRKDANLPAAFEKKHDLDLVLLVGSPGAGKSTFYWTQLQPLGYERANQDALKTRDRCLRAARSFLGEGKSVAVDNTNADEKTRAEWLALAAECGVPVRCVWLQAPPAVCRHNDAVRSIGGCEALNPERRSMLPAVAFAGYASRFRRPQLGEGFADIVEVPFEFRGDEEARRVWGRYWT